MLNLLSKVAVFQLPSCHQIMVFTAGFLILILRLTFEMRPSLMEGTGFYFKSSPTKAVLKRELYILTWGYILTWYSGAIFHLSHVIKDNSGKGTEMTYLLEPERKCLV